MHSDSQEISTQPYPKPKKSNKYEQQDSGFKAWQNDSVLGQNNTNLLRNLKSQLLTYEQKYKRLDSNKTVPIKLPVLQYMKHKKYQSSNNNKTNKTNLTSEQQNALTERKTLQPSQTQNLCKHKSIELNKKTSYSKQSKRFTSQKSKLRQSYTIDHAQQKNQPILITKVQQMKFSQNQKRIRKRDLYLAIFGQRGKGKVQKIEFDDQNKAYQVYLQRKNQQSKISNAASQASQLQKNKIRCSSQLNNRCIVKKPQLIGESVNIMTKNSSHLPMRY